MACGDPCNNNPIHYKNIFKKKKDDCGCTDCKNIIFTGVDLTCTGITTNSNLEDILLAMDAQICSVIGDYSTYDFNCLAEDYVITTEAQFVNAITTEFCTLRDNFNTFTTTTYPSALTNLQTQINQINNPNLTLCSYSGIVSSDSYNSILTKLANRLCDLNSRLDLSTVTWNGCYTVVTPPTTLPQAFQLLSDQICQTVNNIVQPTLPTFNNQGSCLPSPGTADSLVSTIGKIKTRLCQSPIYDIDASPWGCVANPNPGAGADIQSAFDEVLPIVNNLYGNRYEFDTNQFNVTPNGESCDGFTVSLDPSVGIEDRLVAATISDTNPGTLQDKLEEGTNITLDYTDPEKVVINSTFTDQLVKVNVSDPSAGYLSSKVTGGINNGLTITTNVVSNQVQIQPTFDFSTFWNNLATFIQGDITAYNQFCALACGCAPCDSTTTTSAPSTTLRMYIENMSPTESVNLDVVLNQNSPTVGFINNGFNIAPLGATSTGYFNLTSGILPRTVNITLTNPDAGTLNYEVQVDVYQGSAGPLVPGASTYNANPLTTFNNPTFSIGSLSGDIVIKVTIKNVLPA